MLIDGTVYEGLQFEIKADSFNVYGTACSLEHFLERLTLAQYLLSPVNPHESVSTEVLELFCILYGTSNASKLQHFY